MTAPSPPRYLLAVEGGGSTLIRPLAKRLLRKA
jgi:hypothetical protein